MADRYFIERLQDVDSTNRYIRDEASRLWSSSPLSEMLVVTCERQTAGRGQRGNVWHSGDGVNLLFSIMVRPTCLAATRQFLLSEAVALALHRALLHYGIDATLKWPNDIYVGSCKLAGVLVELDYSGSSVEQAIIGVGLNVNQTAFPTMDKQPVSMKNLLHRTLDREEVLARLLHSFGHYYNILSAGEYDALHTAYKSALLGFGERRLYADADGTFEGVIEEVEPTGYLLVRRNDGSLSRYAFKEVQQFV